MFARLYFETSVLVAAGWPRLSADLENVLKFAPGDKILPAGVEIELQHRWQHELEERTSAVKSKIQAVEEHVGRVQKTSVTVDMPERAKALDDYLKAVNALKRKYGLSTGRFTGRAVSEIFAMATVRHPPFKQNKEDVGFRDAVIFLSVVDDLMATKNQVGALVALDEAFHDSRIVEFAARSGVELQVFRSVKDVFDSLVQDAATYVRAKWDAATAEVQRTLESRLTEIEKFISENLEVPASNLVKGARVVAVPRIEALGVGDVRVPNPMAARGLERVRLSFDVRVRVHAKIEKFGMPQTQRVKIGPEKSREDVFVSVRTLSTADPQESPLFNVQREDAEVTSIVRVEANSDASYQTFECESAALMVEGLGGLFVLP
jgi:hypothetical protein